MRPINSLKILGTTLCIAFLALFMQRCTDEDLSECGVGVRFRYVKNVDNKDKFPSDIHKVNLYVFDSDNTFVGEFSDEGSHLDKNYIMRIALKAGKYTFVAWGNKGADYAVNNFVKGVTKYSDAVLSLKRESSTIANHPGKLYYGTLRQTEVKQCIGDKQFITIDFIINTNTIRVVKTGLPVGTKANPTPGTVYSCAITSKNGDYKFDNSYASDERLEYIPQCSVDGKKIISDFVILRELMDGSSDSRLIVKHHSPNGSEREILNVELTTQLIKASKTGNLDIDDYYELLVEFDYTSGNVTVTINGWTVVGGGGIVG